MTRRCTQRQYLLRPSKTVNDVFLYVMAEAARRHGVQVHAFAVMSNHVHLVVTDPDARLPAFQQFLEAFVARAMNAALGRWESFWAPSSYSAVELVSPEDVVEKTAYVLANPVAAGLVRSGRLWPGLWSDPDRFGGKLEAERPRIFFSTKGTMPENVSLELTPPPGFEADEFRDRVSSALVRHEEKARARIGRGFLGVAGVLKQSTTSRPKTVEPRRNLNPRVAARDTWKRIQALTARAEFLRAYRRAWAERRAGNADAVFPAGTYLLRVVHGVPCAGFG